uniref:Xrn1 helical domain-containing protein n=1 Tax=Craspedostauros australis TaxID=1486917 RepID=A0A7R9ZLD0_9STRA|mmetsp:Transcript_13963/g.38375  ORF Transcript_13963/g.38375 Transcript_13963/m.38375 type:complete len:166 (+) Transcript_13963:3-500(+)
MLLPTSPLINFYPPDFKQDPNGKRQPWEAVVQVPFIESDILLETVTQVLDEDKKTGGTLLTPAERRRNVRGKDHLFKPPGGGDVPGPVGGAKRAKKGAAKRKTGSAPPSRSGPRGVRKTGGTSNGNARSKSKSKTVPKRKRAQPKGATRKTGALAEPTTTAEGSD